jgi:hypothetical protein
MAWGLINSTQEKFYPALAPHYLYIELGGMEAKLHLFVIFGSNVVGCVAFLLHTQENSGSNLGPEKGYTEPFRGFTQSLQTSNWIVSQIRIQPFIST